MGKLLAFLGGLFLKQIVQNNPDAGRVFSTVSGVKDVVGIAQDFKQNGWTLNGRSISPTFFGGN